MNQRLFQKCVDAGLFLLLVGIAFFGASWVHAQEGYQPLTGLPGATEPNQLNLAGYVNALFLISISVGGMLAVLRIAFAGFQYMTSGLISSKEKAKEDITGALLGLGILLASFVVLYTINPNLVNLNVLQNAPGVTLENVPTNPTNTGGGGNSGGSNERVSECPGSNYDSAHQACVAQCERTGGTITENFWTHDTCTYPSTNTNDSETTCPEGQEYVLTGNGSGGCRVSTSNIEGNNDTLCPAGQHDIISIVIGGGPQSSDARQYPDGTGRYYTCIDN